MKNTGTIDTGTRPDLYQLIVDNMGLDVERKRVKMAVVPFIYGSEVIPQNVFPDHYEQFVQGYQDTVPGAAWAKDILINAWNPRATEYNMVAPDGGHVKITVVVDKQIIGKYGQHSYTYSFKERGTKNPKENGTKALAAHVTHSTDSFVLREVGRRTNYDMMTVLAAKHALECSLMYGDENVPSDDLQRLVSLAERHNCVSVRAIDYIELGHLQGVPEWYVKELIAILHKMLSHAPFETRDIHDGYGSLANNTWYVQGHYNHVCAQLYKSTWLYNTIADLTGVQHPAPQWKQSIYDQVMNATYALC